MVRISLSYIPHPFLEFRSNFARAPEERGGRARHRCFHISQPFVSIGNSSQSQLPVTWPGPFLPLWGKPQGFGFPTGRAAHDKPAPRFQGAEARAEIPLVALES